MQWQPRKKTIDIGQSSFVEGLNPAQELAIHFSYQILLQINLSVAAEDALRRQQDREEGKGGGVV